MYRILADLDKQAMDIALLQEEWAESYYEQKRKNPSLTFEEFARSSYYDDSCYILIQPSGLCCKANDFFHQNVAYAIS